MSFVITVDVSDRTYDAIMKLANALGANIKTTPTEPVTTQPAPTPAPAKSEQTYTLEQLSAAAAPLMDEGKISELCAILKELGVPSLQLLPADKYGDFAAKIKALGAQI